MPPSKLQGKSRTPRPRKPQLTPHPLVVKLHPDPDSPTDTVALIGYFGPSKKADSVRLYADLTFRRYYDLPTNGIAHTEPSDSKDENSPTIVMVLAGTKLEVVETSAQSVEASYVQGAIARRYLAGASPAAFRSTGQGLASIISNCCPPEQDPGGGGGGGGEGSVFFSGCIGCVPQPSVPCVSEKCTGFCESRLPILC